MGVDIKDIVYREEIPLEQIRGVLAIDAYNIIYQFLANIRGQDNSLLMDSKGRITSHLSGLFYRGIRWYEQDIKPVFVFDGEPQRLKEKEIKKREREKEKAREEERKALEEGDLERAALFAQRSIKVTQDLVESSKELLGYMGFPYLVAKYDAEAQCAYMNSEGDVQGVISQDFDTLLYGGETLYRNVTISGRRKLPGREIFIDVNSEKVILSKTLEKNKITREKLIWIAMLVGTDFNDKAERVGPKTALKLVKNTKTFEELLDRFSYDFKEWKEVQDIFLKPDIVKNYKIEFKKPDVGKIKKFLVDKHDFSEVRVENALQKFLFKHDEKGSQKKLESWF